MTSTPVLPGSAVLAARDFEDLRSLRIGFIANHTALLTDGTHTLTALRQAPGITVGKLFAPEHGAFGALDATVPDEIDPMSGLAIRSLYGATRKPTPQMLEGLDALLFEMQDVGARFYTYSATLCLCVEAAHEAGIPIYVLDRPNPITGAAVNGPLADADLLSFVAPHTVPVRHGLTLGELASLFAVDHGLGDTVRVIRCEGWNRAMWYDESDLAWVNPSPAMRSLGAATLYPGVCLLEQTNVSVGRGTDAPFERAGAPFINAHEWTRALEQEGLPGVSFFARAFTPYSGKYVGENCEGVRMVVTDRAALDSVRLGIALVTTLRDLYGNLFEIEGVQTLLANKAAFSSLISGGSTTEVCATWQESAERWQERCLPIRLYA